MPIKRTDAKCYFNLSDEVLICLFTNYNVINVKVILSVCYAFTPE